MEEGPGRWVQEVSAGMYYLNFWSPLMQQCADHFNGL
jgi:hypothetical protein